MCKLFALCKEHTATIFSRTLMRISWYFPNLFSNAIRIEIWSNMWHSKKTYERFIIIILFGDDLFTFYKLAERKDFLPCSFYSNSISFLVFFVFFCFAFIFIKTSLIYNNHTTFNLWLQLLPFIIFLYSYLLLVDFFAQNSAHIYRYAVGVAIAARQRA